MDVNSNSSKNSSIRALCVWWRKFKYENPSSVGESELEQFLNFICDNEEMEEMVEKIIDIDNEKEDSWPYVPTKQDLKHIQEYFKLAKDDLEVAEILYKKEKYRLAIFHLQQSVEKLEKYFLMRYFRFKPEDLREYVGHKTPIGHLFIIKKFLGVFLKNISKDKDYNFYNFLKAQLNRLENEEYTIKRKTERLAKAPYNEIMEDLKRIDELRDDDFDRFNDLFMEILKLKNIKYINNKKMFEDFKKSLVIIVYTLSIIGKYTYPHESLTRYPSTYTIEYKKGFGIVDAAPEMFKRVRELIKMFEEIESYLKIIKEVSENA